jgi:hypoxanthine-DNA glycosylase
MAQVRSFPPIADAKARVLILGSMPGEASLAAGQYYAHAHNLFWRIIGEVTGADATLPYAARARALKICRIALWDVLASCEREGSLDSAIDDATLCANDFVAFYRNHPHIAHVFFNGAKAEACYRKHVMPALAPGLGPQTYTRLPSTSPANASMSPAYKHRVWMQALRLALAGHACASVKKGSANNDGTKGRISRQQRS